ncbi:MAG: DNA translocase FtsK 4TM domain-containing protein [Alphaproteobacteria bacterium]
MALAIEAPQHPRFLPPQLQRFIKFRALELLGFAMLGVAAVMAIALLSYDALDPSAAMASGQTPANWLGGAGAAASDAALRLIGLAAGIPVLAAASWGLRFCLHQAPSLLWLRIALLPLAVILAAAALSAVPPLASWPLAEGLGGALGASAQNNVWQLLLQIESTMGGAGAATIAGLAAFALITWCAAPPLGPIWRAIRWLWAALRWVYGLGAGAARQASVSRRVITADYDDVDEYDEISAEEPTSRIIEPAAPARSRKALSDRIGGALTGRRSKDVKAKEPKKTPKPPKAPKQRKAPEAPAKPKVRRAKSGKQPDLPLDDGFQLPPLDLLQEADAEAERESDAVLDEKARSLEGVLEDFGVKGEIKHSRQGPVVTLYELEPAPGVKASRVIGLADDLARNMMAISVRVATVPGKNVIGVELPNSIRETVYLRELLASKEYKAAGALPLVLGKDISGAPIIVDLARMPHLLIAGTTGSGKSVAINAMILSLLYAMTPEQCRFIMIDPKMLELSVYDGVPHLLAPVVTEPKKAVVALKWVVREMENRYRAMSTLGVRNIAGYNVKIDEARNKGEALTRRVQTGFDPDTGRPIYEEQALDMRALPFIVVVVDEMADLMLVAGKDIEATIQRLAQMARAAGIHIIMATQRPSVDVITGTIKANFPTRMSFQVTSKIDSRTILGEGGAEQLLGQGDGLYMAGGGRIKRVHGPFVEDEEVSDIVAFLKGQAPPEYIHSVTEDESAADGIPGFDPAGGGAGGDDEAGLYDQAVAIVAKDKKASTSYLQRRLKIGYNRAASLIERMEQEGVVSPANHVGKREILVGDPGADE